MLVERGWIKSLNHVSLPCLANTPLFESFHRTRRKRKTSRREPARLLSWPRNISRRYPTEVESWRHLQSQNIEFTMKRLREPISGGVNVELTEIEIVILRGLDAKPALDVPGRHRGRQRE